MNDRSLKRFQPKEETDVSGKVEFWEVDYLGLPPDHTYKWVRTEGPSPELFKWEHYTPKLAEVNEFELEKLRDETLKEEK